MFAAQCQVRVVRCSKFPHNTIMEAPLYNQKGDTVGKVALSDALFGVRWNPTLIHEMVFQFLGMLMNRACLILLICSMSLI